MDAADLYIWWPLGMRLISSPDDNLVNKPVNRVDIFALERFHILYSVLGM